MQKNPLISVIVPVYNVEKYLDRCVESIVNQTYKNLEIILVDDGSPDNCPQICDDWASKDSRIIVIHKENGGVSSARNAALDIAKGDYIGFVDSDDYLMSNYFELLYQSIYLRNSNISACNFSISKNGKIVDRSHYLKNCYYGKDILVRYLSDIYIDNGVHGKLYSKTVIGNNRFEEDIKNGEDFLFNYYVFKCTDSLIHITEALYVYEIINESASHRVSSSLVNRWQNTKRVLIEINDDELKNVCIIKYSRELICCIKELLNSNNQELIDSCYDNIVNEVKNNIFLFLTSKCSTYIKINAIFLAYFKEIYKYLYRFFIKIRR